VTKDKLRRSLREKRKAFVIEEKKAVPLPQKLLECARSVTCVGGYAATRWEASLDHWWTRLLDARLRIALPYLADREGVMDFRGWDGTSPLEKAAFGFDQPVSSSVVIIPNIVLVPLIGFDRKGNRLGQGAGHYDRYFMKYYNCLKIGIAWSCQEVDSVPTDPWDVPLNAVITECGWIDCFPHKDIT
jgi:5-formyltetrahydrofolate cyclo-ligase